MPAFINTCHLYLPAHFLRPPEYARFTSIQAFLDILDGQWFNSVIHLTSGADGLRWLPPIELNYQGIWCSFCHLSCIQLWTPSTSFPQSAVNQLRKSWVLHFLPLPYEHPDNGSIRTVKRICGEYNYVGTHFAKMCDSVFLMGNKPSFLLQTRTPCGCMWRTNQTQWPKLSPSMLPGESTNIINNYLKSPINNCMGRLYNLSLLGPKGNFWDIVFIL